MYLFLLTEGYCCDDIEKIAATLDVNPMESQTKSLFIHCIYDTVSDCGEDDIIPTLC